MSKKCGQRKSRDLISKFKMTRNDEMTFENDLEKAHGPLLIHPTKSNGHKKKAKQRWPRRPTEHKTDGPQTARSSQNVSLKPHNETKYDIQLSLFSIRRMLLATRRNGTTSRFLTPLLSRRCVALLSFLRRWTFGSETDQSTHAGTKLG